LKPVTRLWRQSLELVWFTPPQLPHVDLNRFTRALLRATGHLAT